MKYCDSWQISVCLKLIALVFGGSSGVHRVASDVIMRNLAHNVSSILSQYKG